MIHHAGTNSLPSVLSLPDVYLHDPLIELQCTDLCCPCHAKWIFQSMSRTTSTEVQIGQNRSSSAREFPTGCLRKLSYRVHEKSAIEIWQPWDLLLDLKTQVQHFHSLWFQSLIFFYFFFLNWLLTTFLWSTRCSWSKRGAPLTGSQSISRLWHSRIYVYSGNSGNWCLNGCM